MRINHNIQALNTHRALGVNTSNASKNIEKLSSGFRINRAADDAAGLSISEKMRSQIRGMEQSVRNAQDGISLIQTAEGALSTVNDMLVRIKELATQAANGTLQQENRERIQEEVTELAKEIENIEKNTKFNGIALLSGGTSASVTVQIGHEQGQTLALDASKFSIAAVQNYVSGLNFGAAGATGQTNAQNALAASGGIDDQIKAVASARSYLGAQQNRLEHTINNLNITVENLTASESRIRDVDMAKEMMEFTKNNILTQSAQSMLAQANQSPQGVLQLLR